MNCQHLNTKFTLTPELTHYGREDCLDCGRFVRWVKHPQTIALLAENAKKLVWLKAAKLSDWEGSFILSLEKQGRPSPKQQAKLDEVALRHGYPA